MKRRFIVLWYTFKKGGKEKRRMYRAERMNLISTWKQNLVRDLMTGHNVGDYRIQDSDLKFFIMSDGVKNLTVKKINELYKRYRGNDLDYLYH